MSKICFLTDRLPTDPDPFSTLMWNQFIVLAESQHDVVVVSHLPPPEGERWQHPRLQVVQPFPSWSIRYLPRFIQLLAGHKPDVLHWVEPAKPKLHHLQWVTPALAALRKRPLLAMSLWNPHSWEKSWLVSGTLPTMDLLFVSHPTHREMLWQNWPQMMSRVVLAPLLFDQDVTSSHWVTTWADEFDFVPGDLADVSSIDELVESLAKSLKQNEERKAVIPVASREHRFQFLERLRDHELDARVAIFENLDWATWSELFTKARTIRADVLSAKSPFLSLAMQWSKARNRTIQLNQDQQSLILEVNWQDAFNFLGRTYQAAFKDKEARLH
jgi:hypothetical protein